MQEVAAAIKRVWTESCWITLVFPKQKKPYNIIEGRTEVESSGGITHDTLVPYAECGVDFISVGALTHHIKGLDMSLKAL